MIPCHFVMLSPSRAAVRWITSTGAAIRGACRWGWRGFVLRLLALVFAVAVPVSAFANTVIVLNSDDDSMSVISGSDRKELSRVPIGRAPHHLMLTPDRQ